jgi:hypothetical protein
VLRSEQGVSYDLAEARHGRIDTNSTLFSSWFAALSYGPKPLIKLHNAAIFIPTDIYEIIFIRDHVTRAQRNTAKT